MESETPQDLSAYRQTNGSLVFDIKVTEQPLDKVELRIDCGYPCASGVDIGGRLRGENLNWRELSVPLACFEATDFSKVSSAFLIQTEGPMVMSIGNVRFVPGSPDEARSCSF